MLPFSVFFCRDLGQPPRQAANASIGNVSLFNAPILSGVRNKSDKLTSPVDSPDSQRLIGTHSKPSVSSSSSMMNFFHISWNCRSCKHKLTIVISMINFKPNGIPKLRNMLPFINQTWRFSFKQKRILVCAICLYCSCFTGSSI